MVRKLVVVATVASVWILIAQTPITPPPDPPAQPLPFSHKAHVALNLECGDCHSLSGNGYFAGLPDTAKCMPCHVRVKADSPAIQKLAGFHSRKEEIPWEPVYRIPDYVDFGHKAHMSTGRFTCQTCHGPVQERDALFREYSLTMQACMDCHRQNRAPLRCNFCHDRP